MDHIDPIDPIVTRANATLAALARAPQKATIQPTPPSHTNPLLGAVTKSSLLNKQTQAMPVLAKTPVSSAQAENDILRTAIRKLERDFQDFKTTTKATVEQLLAGVASVQSASASAKSSADEAKKLFLSTHAAFVCAEAAQHHAQESAAAATATSEAAKSAQAGAASSAAQARASAVAAGASQEGARAAVEATTAAATKAEDAANAAAGSTEAAAGHAAAALVISEAAKSAQASAVACAAQALASAAAASEQGASTTAASAEADASAPAATAAAATAVNSASAAMSAKQGGVAPSTAKAISSGGSGSKRGLAEAGEQGVQRRRRLNPAAPTDTISAEAAAGAFDKHEEFIETHKEILKSRSDGTGSYSPSDAEVLEAVLGVAVSSCVATHVVVDADLLAHALKVATGHDLKLLCDNAALMAGVALGATPGKNRGAYERYYAKFASALERVMAAPVSSD